MTSNLLYDKIINVTLKKTWIDSYDPHKGLIPSIGQVESLSIECKDYGQKPDIELRFGELPDSKRLSITVSIRNLYSQVNIKSWQAMEIQAGYKNSLITFYVDLFSAWVEGPAPDGVTMFMGFVSTKDTGLLFNRVSIDVVLLKRSMTVRSIVEAVGKAIVPAGGSQQVVYAFPPEMENVHINVGKQTKHFNNVSAAVAWLNNTLLSGITDESIRNKLYVSYTDNGLFAGMAGYMTAKHKLAIVELDNINHASFSGPLLTVDAPWIPQLRPNGIFKMKPTYFEGKMLPQTPIAEIDFTGQNDNYRVIKMEIEFGTVSKANRMVITAVPIQLEPLQFDENTLKEQWPSDVIEIGTKMVNGVKQTNDDSEQPGTQVGTIKWWEGGNINAGEVYIVRPGDTCSKIAAKKWKKLPFLTKTREFLSGKNLPDGPNAWRNPPSYPASSLWPIIALATYNRMQSDKSFYINTEAPDLLKEGTQILIPDISAPSGENKTILDNPDLIQCKELFNYFYQIKIPGTKVANMFGTIYVFLGGQLS